MGRERVGHTQTEDHLQRSAGEHGKRRIRSFTQQASPESRLSLALPSGGSQSSGGDRSGSGNDTNNSLITTVVHSLDETGVLASGRRGSLLWEFKDTFSQVLMCKPGPQQSVSREKGESQAPKAGIRIICMEHSLSAKLFMLSSLRGCIF